MPKLPDSIAEGTPTRAELGRYLENAGHMFIRTPPANQAYRDNYDAVFGKKEAAEGEAPTVEQPRVSSDPAPKARRPRKRRTTRTGRG